MTELADFVLNYCRHAGALVEPAADGVYDVLLPDDLTAQWRVPALQRFAFEDVGPSAEVTRLGYGHPLVEQMAESARSEPLCGRLYVNQVRLDKHGLADLARAALTLPNARLVEAPRQTESRAMCHYVRFNFKAALITDEKREQLVSVMMDAQAGHAVKELARIEELAPLEAAPAFKNLSPAPMRWSKEANPLSRAALDELLQRATHAALDELAPAIEGLQLHAARYLDLDRARLEEYYDQIERDLQRRAERAADEDKRAGVESKLAAARAERQSKLADVEAKYKLRVELALVNLLVVEQPKVVRVVQIENRTTTVTRTVVWDPLLHHIEPLAARAASTWGCATPPKASPPRSLRRREKKRPLRQSQRLHRPRFRSRKKLTSHRSSAKRWSASVRRPPRPRWRVGAKCTNRSALPRATRYKSAWTRASRW